MNTLGEVDKTPADEALSISGAGQRKSLVRELLCLIKSDRLVQVGFVVLILTAALVAFVSYSSFPLDRPLMGLVLYSTLPLLWVVGAIVFILAILRH